MSAQDMERSFKRGFNTGVMADEYARNARTFTDKPYSIRWRKMLRLWWMAGWRNERYGFPQHGTNFEAPLRRAWSDGRRAHLEMLEGDE